MGVGGGGGGGGGGRGVSSFGRSEDAAYRLAMGVLLIWFIIGQGPVVLAARAKVRKLFFL